MVLALKAQDLSREHVERVVTQSVDCYQELGDQEYRKSFCQKMKNEHRGFDYYATENEKEVKLFVEKLKQDLAGKNLSPKLRAMKRLIDDETQACQAEAESESDLSAPPLEKSSQSAAIRSELEENLLFPYDKENDAFAMDPQVMNTLFMELINSTSYDGIKDYNNLHQRANSLAQRAMQLRRKIYLDHPELIIHLADSRSYVAPNQESFWSAIYEQTGLTKNDFSDSQKKAFESRVAIAQTQELLKNYRLSANTNSAAAPRMRMPRVEDIQISEDDESKLDLVLPDTDETADEDTRPLLTVDLLMKETGLERALATETLLKFNIHDGTNYQKQHITPIVASALTGARREEVIALGALHEEILNDLKEAQVSLREDVSEGETASDADEYDYCADQRERRIRDFASLEHLSNFYNDKANVDFMTSTFTKAQGLMQRTIQNSNMSAETKQKLIKHIAETKLEIPQVSAKDLETYAVDSARLYFEAKNKIENAYASELINGLQEQMNYTAKYYQVYKARQLTGVNAFYSPDDLDGDEAHKVTCTCGMAGKAVQNNNPDFLLGVMGHELGHALDPTFSARTRANFSAHSREMIDELRACLIKTNNNLWTKSGEDYADHWESLFRQQMLVEEKNQADWPLRRLKMMLEQYSIICQGEENVIEGHSVNSYRFTHVYSNPELRREYSEFNLPQVPYCDQIQVDTSREK